MLWGAFLLAVFLALGLRRQVTGTTYFTVLLVTTVTLGVVLVRLGRL